MLRKVSDDATKEGYILIKYIVQGGTKLSGSVTISGAKNAAVAILPATLLVSGPCRIENVPDISDVRLLLEILRDMGAEIHRYGRNTLEIDCSRARNATAPIELVRRIRASYYLIGAELGRFGHAHVAMPGGCNFGVRPIDQHIKGFEAMGAMVEQSGGYVCADAPKGGLRGGHIYLDIVSVGATMNILLAAVLCSGMTIIENCAKEPHIVDLANFLNAMGAQVSGAGTDVIKVRGVRALHGGSYSIIPDQIEAGTYMTACAAAGGEVRLANVIPRHLECISAKLREMGVTVVEGGDSVLVRSNGRLRHTNVKTQPYPGFPTDAQPLMLAACLKAKGTSVFVENVFQNRFRYTEELTRLGARIHTEGRVAVVTGVRELHGAPTVATDLRGGAALIIAGLSAEGETEILDSGHIERGYESFDTRLRELGAEIQRTASA